MNKKKINTIVGSIGAFIGVFVFITYIPQIIANLGGEKAQPWQPLTASISCLIWVIYGWTKEPKKDFILIVPNLVTLYLGDKVIMFCFYFLCLITYFLQKRGYERNKLKNERNKYNEHINILLAENERNRIGQDLHDSIGHTFVMLKLKAELAEKYLQKNNIEAAKKELSEISKISKESMDNTRAIVNKLKHRTVEEEIKIIQDIMIMSDIQLNLNNNFTTKPIGLQEWTITMILKELTNNIIKHSKANKCDIILDESNKNYTITAKDNGCGFEILTGSELASIRERIKVVDGKIEILSKKEPTIIRVTISKDN